LPLDRWPAVDAAAAAGLDEKVNGNALQFRFMAHHQTSGMTPAIPPCSILNQGSRASDITPSKGTWEDHRYDAIES
jgi:hypothetical protein